MLKREDVIGHRIKSIVADTTLTDGALNFADFVCELDNGVAFRLPYDDESDDWFGAVELSMNHEPISFPRKQWWHYSRRLWWATVSDVLVPADPDLRYPDSARVALSSGWFLAQMSGAPTGILPCIDIMPELNAEDPMVTIWSC